MHTETYQIPTITVTNAEGQKFYLQPNYQEKFNKELDSDDEEIYYDAYE